MRTAAFRNQAPAPMAQKPMRVVTLPPSAFADTWKGRPKEPVRIGLRLVGEDIIDSAEELAREDVADIPVGDEGSERRMLWIDAYNTSMMRHVLAHAMCSPDDISRYYFTDAPNDKARVALTPRGIRRLWEEFEALQIETSPTSPEASDDDLVSLAGMLSLPDPLSGIEADEARRLRRLIARVRNELLAALPE